MAYLRELLGNIALVMAIICGPYVLFGLVRWAVRDPRGFARKLSGELALAFGGLAILWLAVMGELRGWW